MILILGQGRRHTPCAPQGAPSGVPFQRVPWPQAVTFWSLKNQFLEAVASRPIENQRHATPCAVQVMPVSSPALLSSALHRFEGDHSRNAVLVTPSAGLDLLTMQHSSSAATIEGALTCSSWKHGTLTKGKKPTETR